jgi:hypothetical protein
MTGRLDTLEQRRVVLPIAAAAAALLFSLAGPLAAAHSAAASSAEEVYVLTSRADSVVRDSHPLFDGTILVPRATAHDRFAVQNGSGGTAYLRVALISVEVPDDGLRRSLTLGVSTAQGAGPVVPLDSPGSCVTLLSGQSVAPGATVDVDAALALGDLAGTSGQSQPIDFSFLVVLDADPAGAGCDTGGAGGGGGSPPPGTPERPHDPPLAATGSDILAPLWVAAALGGAGTVAVLVSRAHVAKRRGARHHSTDGA